MPYIAPNFIEELESRIDIVELIGNFVELKRQGSTYVGLSPFTNENTPSFTVSPSKQLWKCFSSGYGGNAISFFMELKKMSYPEAIEEIARLQGMQIEYDNSEASQRAAAKMEKKIELAPLMNYAAQLYHTRFKSLPPSHPAKIEVYDHRGYTDSMVNRWMIGYAPGNKTIYETMVEKGQKEPAKSIGLITDNNDKYYERLIIPIVDHKGVVCGIAGRDLTGGKTAKWINPVESELYEKSKILFGFHEAREHIAKTKTARLVEGYNDVISAHEYGLNNTVGISGTAISQEQIRMLKKLADQIILMLDVDKAGIKAAEKYIPQLLAAGFRVEIVAYLGISKDIDDFCRDYEDSVNHYGLDVMMSEKGVSRDGFGWLMDIWLTTEDTIEKGERIKDLCKIIAMVEDDVKAEIYTQWLVEKSDFTRTKINQWVKTAQAKEEEPRPIKSPFENVMYHLPQSVKVSLEEVQPTIEKYQLFQAENQIFVQVNDEPPYFFRSVSNFSIEIIQHMADEKFPMKLLRVKNIHGEEKIFDVPSSEINTPQSFDKVLTDQGNFFWRGGRNELIKLREYLYDNMGTGRKIDVLGWQPEGFWAWNNQVRLEDGEEVKLDENGIINVDGTSYYIPSANKIYSSNAFKYVAQKKIKVMKSPVSFQTYAERMMGVHREHAITGLLFTVASLFQDIVVNDMGSFPMLFLYGPASSGKDQMAECCQSFFGFPQEAINLEGGVSTIKAQVREFAQFSNLISHLSEYHRGDPKLDGVLKGLWDRRGYKRGNLDSHVGTESIPILSSVLMTGNDYPDNEALITRLITEEMITNQFDEGAVKRFEDLEDITKQGISSLGDELLKFRPMIKSGFQRKFRMFKQGISDHLPEAKSRMIGNISVLGSFFHLLKDHVNFPFDHQMMTDHLVKITNQQMRKLASSSVITRWWDCFLAAMRGHRMDRLQVERDFEIKNGYLYFNFTNAYNRVQLQWYQQYRENAPGKMKLADDLRKDPAFVEDKKSERIGETNTSAMMINLKEVAIHEELQNAMEWQKNENTLFNGTPTQKQDEAQTDMPF